MSKTTSTGLGGGIFLTLGPIGGLIVGGQFGEPIIGMLIGLGLGIALVALIWFLQR